MAHTRKSNMLSRRTIRLTLAFMLIGAATLLLLNDNRFLTRRVEAAGFVVTNTNDSGAGSLRQAIVDSNNNGSAVTDTITFNIPGGGVKTIKPLSKYPSIQTPVTIDGYTQPNSTANTNVSGPINAVPRIELDGSSAGADAHGLFIEFQAVGTVVRGLVINRFDGYGIRATSANVKIEGCFIGTDASGTSDLGNNQSGILLFDHNVANNIVGGTTAAARNLISGNNANGVSSAGGGLGGPNTIQGNLIGTDKTGTVALGNSGAGIITDGSGWTIGGTASGAGNVIAHHDFDGIIISGAGTGNSILRNSIYANGELGIDLNQNGVTANDPGDTDAGANGSQNFPVLTSATHNGFVLTITGTLSSAPNKQYRLEFYADSTCDPSGNGEGKTFIGSTDVTTSASGTVEFDDSNLSPVEPGQAITATATDKALNNTSEFSQCVQLGGPPAISITDISVQEGNVQGFSTPATFAVTLSKPGLFPVSVQYMTGGGTASGSIDYQFISGAALNFAPGETTKNVTIPVVGDSYQEPDETFTLNLHTPTNATIADNQGQATILNDDAPPDVSISDVAVSEGNSGFTKFTFIVSLSYASQQSRSVEYTTADGSAAAGEDYLSKSNTLIFPVGAQQNSIVIDVKGDFDVETDQTFFVNLSNPVNASIAKAQGQGTILNDDGLSGTLQFSQNNPTVKENQGSITVTVTRTGGSFGSVSVQYATSADLATAGEDYTEKSGTLTFADGETSKSFEVAIINDNTFEPDESIRLVLSNPTGGATLGSPNNIFAAVVDDDPEPIFNISDVTFTEGGAGGKAVFVVSRTNDSAYPYQITWSATDITAQQGSDYLADLVVVDFKQGEMSKEISVPITDDDKPETEETFMLEIHGASAPGSNQIAKIGKSQGIGTIKDNDSGSVSQFNFTSSDLGVKEDLGAAIVTVNRSGDTSTPASVDYTTVDNTAVQKHDYEFAAGTLHFAPGETSKTITLLVNEDAHLEGDETFKVTLSNPSGATLGATSTTSVAIVDDLPESPVSPLDDTQSFVYLHYHDFLNREPDAAGLQFWVNEIESCGADVQCREAKRINTSAAFFLSIEFQETGYLRYLLQKESFATTPKYTDFMRDVQEVSNGVIVNSPGWEQKLKDNQQQFADRWVNRPAFKALYDGMSNAEFVNAIYANAGILPTQAKRESLVNALDANNQSRAAVLLEVAADSDFRQKEYSAAFVLMQYFGYLRRDPDAAPDSDLSGYNFWLMKLNSFNGDFQQAEMVRAFLDSFEYRGRFAQ